MKKIGLICLALVLAMGALGAAYSAWFDEVTIWGDVYTGSLDLEVTRVNGDDVYKRISTGELVYDHWIYDYEAAEYLDPKLPEDPDLLLVANSDAMLVDDDWVRFYWNNLFPIDTLGWGGFVASAYIHALGSVPMHLIVDGPYISGIPESWVSYGWILYEYEGGPVLASGDSIRGLDGLQLHFCNRLSVWVIITVPQEQEAMGQEGMVDFSLTGIQWNEYP
jgi:hypothetical protein